MPETDERLSKAKELANSAEGFMSDAEFRSEHETKLVRYMQSVSHSLLAICLQNEVLLERLGEQG